VDPDLTQAVSDEFAALHAHGWLTEHRAGQLAMARAVAQAIADRRHLVVRAGTGVGKTSAYLIPAILSGHRVVVSTSTKSLQEQIAERDLPALRTAMRRDVIWAVVKGRSNYLCRQRLAESGQDATPDTAAFRRLVDWAAITRTGDRDELDREPPDAAWRRVSVRTDECPGRDRCPSGDTCFAERARSLAADADVVITNHYVYAASLAASRHLLPDHRVVVFDEAHQLDEAIRQTTSTQVDPARIARIVGAAGDGPFEQLRIVLAAHAGRHHTRLPPPLAAALDAAGELVREHAAAQRALAKAGGDRAQRRAHTLALIGENIALSRSDPQRPMWVDGTESQPILRTFPARSSATQRTAR
jgi:ATP-dependent DNA helicase DinG